MGSGISWRRRSFGQTLQCVPILRHELLPGIGQVNLLIDHLALLLLVQVPLQLGREVLPHVAHVHLPSHHLLLPLHLLLVPLQQVLPSDQISEQDVLVQLSRPGVQIAQPVPHLDQVALETKRPVPPVGHCSTNYHEEQDYDWSCHVDGAV